MRLSSSLPDSKWNDANRIRRWEHALFYFDFQNHRVVARIAGFRATQTSSFHIAALCWFDLTLADRGAQDCRLVAVAVTCNMWPHCSIQTSSMTSNAFTEEPSNALLL